jgi:hypothetical protein
MKFMNGARVHGIYGPVTRNDVVSQGSTSAGLAGDGAKADGP